MKNLCLYLLTNNTVSENVVPVVIELMVKILPNVEDRLQALAEAISEVREPMIEQEVESTSIPVPTLSNEEIRQRELKVPSLFVFGLCLPGYGLYSNLNFNSISVGF